MTIEQRLIKDYGTTDGPALAVWMLRDGTYINGTIEGFQRDVDHHEISQYFKRSKHIAPGSYTGYVYKFMRRGNIRIGCSDSGWCFEMATVPLRKQANELYQAIIDAKRCGTKACFGRNPRTRSATIWESDIDFIKYLNRYTDYWPSREVQLYYLEMTGRFLEEY